MGSTDSLHYYNAYVRAQACDSFSLFYNPDGFELGFQLFVWLLSRFPLDAQFLFFATGAIYSGCAMRLIYRMSDDMALSVLFYIISGLIEFEMQGMRQALAISMCMLAFLAACDRKPVKFIVLIVIACSFHQTAILFAIVYVVCRLDFSLKGFALTVIPVAAMVILGSRVAVLGNIIFGRDYSGTLSDGGYGTALLSTFEVLFPLMLDAKIKEKPHCSLLYLAVIHLGIFLTMYTGVFLASRIAIYFSFPFFLVIPNAICRMRDGTKGQKASIAVLVAALFICFFLYRLHGSLLVPYTFFS